MDKMKQLEIDKEYIINFLVCDYEKPVKEHVILAAILNIGMFCGAVYLAENKKLCIFMVSIINILILSSLILFLRKNFISKKKLNLYMGIYSYLTSLSSGILVYIFLKNEFIKYHILIIIVELCCFVLVSIIRYKICVERMRSNAYQYGFEEVPTPIVAIVFGIMMFNEYTSTVSRDLYYGLLLGIVFIVMVERGMKFLIKSYGYYCVNEEVVEKYFQKRKAQNATFTRYGKKK